MKHKLLLSLATLASLSVSPLVLAAADVPLATIAVQGAGSTAAETSLDAVVEAVRQTTLSAQVPGAIVALNVKAGDQVKAGQELIRIDARAAEQNVAGSQAQVEAAQAALKVASRELERQQALFQKQYISQGALDRAQAQWEAAQAQLKALQAQTGAARAQSGFFVLKAPYAGVVSELPVTLGDMAMPGRPLLTLHDPSALRVIAAVPQALLPALGANLKAVRYELPGLAGLDGRQPPAQVHLLPSIDPVTHTAQLRLSLPTGLQGITPGLFARVWLPAASSAEGDKRFYLPASAIVRRAELNAVYVVDAQGKPRLRQVRLGRSAGDQVEVLSGLRAGEQVATDPQAAARR
jgi:membrane fusion protein, multidrug efflux system